MSPIYLCGPTAVGKSAVALELAQRLGGEIISVDSMQVYRGLDIGAAKPSAVDRAKIPHHLIDVADLDSTFSAATFVELARAAESQIKTPIYCGGTGLYFNALLQGLGEAPPSDAILRAKLESTPLVELLEKLKQRDLPTWEKIDRKNPRRVIRALEVIELTGRPFSGQRADWKIPSAKLIAMDMDRAALHDRINARVDAMFQAGLIEETRALLKKGLRENQTASQALGYKQVIDHLDGKISLRETIELVKLRTRQFAKRQFTWFNRKLPCRWIKVKDSETVGDITSLVQQAMQDDLQGNSGG